MTEAFSNENVFQREPLSISQKQLWTGRVISGFATLFMLFDGVAKLFKPVSVLEGCARLGYPESTIVGIGISMLICTVLYVVPRTAILGAVLVTGYLGGAVASNIRVRAGWFETAFPILFACLVWGGLWLRNQRVRELVGVGRA